MHVDILAGVSQMKLGVYLASTYNASRTTTLLTLNSNYLKINIQRTTVEFVW